VSSQTRTTSRPGAEHDDTGSDDAVVLSVPHRATVLSQRDGRHYSATVHSWSESSSGPVARVTVREGAALRLAANRVWVSMPSPGRGFVVYSGRARRVGDTFLDLHHLEPVTEEVRRRIAPRVETDVPVTVVTSRHPRRRTTARDLSHGGVRLAGTGTEPLGLGERVVIDLELGGVAVMLRGEVTRVDAPSGDAVVRFDGAPAEQRVAIDRFVLARLDEESARR
jgi:hypothetical protein